MDRIRVGVEEADGEGLDAGSFDEVADRPAYPVEVQRLGHRPVGGHPLADLPPLPPGDERIGPRQPEIEEVVALLEADVEKVAEPRGHQHPRPRSPALDDRVGDEGGAVGDGVDVAHRDAFAPEEGGYAFEHRRRGVDGRLERVLAEQPQRERVHGADHGVVEVGAVRGEGVVGHHLAADALAHLGRGRLGEGDGGDLGHLGGAEQPQVALHEHVRLAAPRARGHGEVGGLGLDDGALLAGQLDHLCLVNWLTRHMWRKSQ